jgi:nitrate reductase beta subunit
VQNTCGGTTLKQNLEPVILPNGKTRISYKGGWEKNGDSVSLKGAGKLKGLKNIFPQSLHACTLEDYYVPWAYKYQ